MPTHAECLLKANNYEMAARMADTADRMMYLQLAAQWRQLAHQLQMERFGPFGSANILPGEAGPMDWSQGPHSAD